MTSLIPLPWSCPPETWWKLMEVDGSWWNHHVAMLFAWRPSPSFPMESSGHQSDWFSLSLRGTRHGTIQFSSSSKWNRIPSPVWMGSVSSFLFLSSSLSLTSIIRNDIIVIIIPCFFCSRIMSGGINSCRRALSNLQSNKWNNSFTSSAGGGRGGGSRHNRSAWTSAAIEDTMTLFHGILRTLKRGFEFLRSLPAMAPSPLLLAGF